MVNDERQLKNCIKTSWMIYSVERPPWRSGFPEKVDQGTPRTAFLQRHRRGRHIQCCTDAVTYSTISAWTGVSVGPASKLNGGIRSMPAMKPPMCAHNATPLLAALPSDNT